jgi:hypothetical protein
LPRHLYRVASLANDAEAARVRMAIVVAMHFFISILLVLEVGAHGAEIKFSHIYMCGGVALNKKNFIKHVIFLIQKPTYFQKHSDFLKTPI